MTTIQRAQARRVLEEMPANGVKPLSKAIASDPRARALFDQLEPAIARMYAQNQTAKAGLCAARMGCERLAPEGGDLPCATPAERLGHSLGIQ
jgi:hypothetical protein